ncbi:eukaryotic translation initiation factor 3 subunit J [Fukomys damarensis]|uniref:eukaryotic translation initiation factor 3 subunit J n=1 Tax=Fukomys damarensis TaxID=885580 RepID=UPI00145533AC|nr:eukaryotic translation initiation factor 3 subunit J [Fukomys damarensis]
MVPTLMNVIDHLELILKIYKFRLSILLSLTSQIVFGSGIILACHPGFIFLFFSYFTILTSCRGSGGTAHLDNWDDDEEDKKEEAEVKPEIKISEKKKIAEKIKEKERQQKKRQEEIKKRLEEPEEPKVLTLEEQLADKLRLKKLQEESDLELAKETFGVNNTVYGIDAMNPSSRDDFMEFGKLLKDKITQYEKSLYYASFLEALVRDVCISLEIDDLKKITNSLTVLCSEKQKQEKQSKAKKKKKGVVPGGGLKATMKDDLADYGGYDGGYVQDYEDFM